MRTRDRTLLVCLGLAVGATSATAQTWKPPPPIRYHKKKAPKVENRVGVGIGVAMVFAFDAYDFALDEEHFVPYAELRWSRYGWKGGSYFTARAQAMVVDADHAAFGGDFSIGKLWRLDNGKCHAVRTGTVEVGYRQYRPSWGYYCARRLAFTLSAGARAMAFRGGPDPDTNADPVFAPQVGLSWYWVAKSSRKRTLSGSVDINTAVDALGAGFGLFLDARLMYGGFQLGVNVEGFFSYGGQALIYTGYMY